MEQFGVSSRYRESTVVPETEGSDTRSGMPVAALRVRRTPIAMSRLIRQPNLEMADANTLAFSPIVELSMRLVIVADKHLETKHARSRVRRAASSMFRRPDSRGVPLSCFQN